MASNGMTKEFVDMIYKLYGNSSAVNILLSRLVKKYGDESDKRDYESLMKERDEIAADLFGG